VSRVYQVEKAANLSPTLLFSTHRGSRRGTSVVSRSLWLGIQQSLSTATGPIPVRLGCGLSSTPIGHLDIVICATNVLFDPLLNASWPVFRNVQNCKAVYGVWAMMARNGLSFVTVDRVGYRVDHRCIVCMKIKYTRGDQEIRPEWSDIYINLGRPTYDQSRKL
jgi:hypothetical protein